MKKLISLLFLLLFSSVCFADNCQDSDSHLGDPDQLLEKGTCTDSSGNYEDECVPDGMIREYKCTTYGTCSGGATFNCNAMQFDGNYKCENGKCIQTTESAEGKLILTNYEYNIVKYQDKKHITVFIDIYNEGNLHTPWYGFKFTINGKEESIDETGWLNPKESKTQRTTFEAVEGTNSVSFQILDQYKNVVDDYSTTIIVEIAKDECSSDTNCDDSNFSTKDICEGDPKKCSNIKITTCEIGDKYCPEECTYENDKDCPEPDQCLIDLDCDDDNACTDDVCSGNPKKCSNDKISEGCNSENNCVSVSTRIENEYCDESNLMKEQKSNEQSCDNNYECISDICEDNICNEPSSIQNAFNKLASNKKTQDGDDKSVISEENTDSEIMENLNFGGIPITAIIISFVILFSLLLFLFLKKKKTSNINMQRVQQLKDYILYNIKKGVNSESLRNDLLKRGHQKEEIDMAFKTHNGKTN